jgi:hypothetical protein
MCMLCRAKIENKDHLFFKSSFAQRIWKQIKQFCCTEDLNDKWHNIIAWAELNWTSKTLEADYCRLGLSVAVYHIWAQRNAILHHGYVKTVEQIVNIIR